MRRSPAWIKLAVALGLVIAIVQVPINGWRFFLAIGVFLSGVAVLSKIPIAFLIRRLILLEPLVLGVALVALLQPHGGRVFLTMITKSTLCLLTMILLSNTTPFAEMLRSLQRLRVPALLITTLALMYRYLFVLVEETERMKRARASRTFTRQWARDWKMLATVVGHLFVRSTERAERIYLAMCARGWK